MDDAPGVLTAYRLQTSDHFDCTCDVAMSLKLEEKKTFYGVTFFGALGIFVEIFNTCSKLRTTKTLHECLHGEQAPTNTT